jgi:hypothetical protein
MVEEGVVVVVVLLLMVVVKFEVLVKEVVL